MRIENEERRGTCSIPTRSEPESPPPRLPFSLSLRPVFGAALVPLYSSLSFSFSRSPFYDSSPFHRLSAASTGRSAPDYLSSECLIEALYRWDPESLASLDSSSRVWRRRPGLLSSSSSLPLLFSIAAFTLTLVPRSSFLLLPSPSTSTSLHLFVYLLVADTSLPRQIHR